MPSIAKKASSRAAIAERIREIRQKYVDTGEASDFADINSGSCDDFARDVIEVLGGGQNVHLHDVSPASFQVVEDENYGEGRPFDRKLLCKHWPNVQPPSGLTWDDLDRFSVDASVDNGTHVWLTDDKLHYDAEAPDGVENFFDLPFFQRVIGRWRKHRLRRKTNPKEHFHA